MLAPDLESEAEAITQQAGEDAAANRWWWKPPARSPTGLRWRCTRRGASAMPLPSSRPDWVVAESWRRAADGWRQGHVDCVLFAGGGAVLTELRPLFAQYRVYATSAAYETSLERTVDWTGVRIADAPWLIDAERAEFAGFAPAPAQTGTPTPPLFRRHWRGSMPSVDAARLALVAGREALPTAFDGAIGPSDAAGLAIPPHADGWRIPRTQSGQDRALTWLAPCRHNAQRHRRAFSSATPTFLMQHGLIPVERNWRCRMGEIDLIMRDGETLVFVEVRKRDSQRLAAPPAASDDKSANGLERAIALYLSKPEPHAALPR